MRRIIRGVEKFTIKSERPFIVQCCHAGEGHIKDPDSPLGTVLAHHAEGIVSPSLIQYHTEHGEHVRASQLEEPINTIDTSNRYGLSSVCLVEYFGNGNPLDAAKPVHTITTKDREAVTAAHICKFKGQDIGQKSDFPLHTITAGSGEFAAIKAITAKYYPGADMRFWPEIRALLNEHCGYALAEDEVILLRLGEAWCFIADIGLRMLTPRELYNANGFPEDYIIDHDYTGKEYQKAKQVARCGNAVPPPFAAALVQANLPEWCTQRYETLAQLKKAITA